MGTPLNVPAAAVARCAVAGGERRADRRVAAADTRWTRWAMVRPGRMVELVNLSAGGACVRGPARLLPGRRAELQLAGRGGRRAMAVLVVRCAVTRLEPLEYEGGLAFDVALPDLLEPWGSG